ncbi:MAG: hypothetical protein AAF828_02665 [Bacteroidota bacterium]
MKYPSLLLLLSLFFSSLSAQSTPAEQTVPLDGIEHISIYAPFSSVLLQPESTASMAVQHIVKIDGKDAPELRELSIQRKGNTLHIEELSPNIKALKKRFPAGFDRNGGTNRYGANRDCDEAQTKVDARLSLKIPAGVTIDVETEYGSIVAEDVPGLRKAYAHYGSVEVSFASTAQVPTMNLHSHYGAVDVTLPSAQNASLDLTTEYGELFTDFDISIDKDASEEEDFLQKVVGQLGRGGAEISCRAPYGNVYLRQGSK